MIMAMDPTPWMVGGGAEHTVETSRLLVHMENSGQEGVAEPGDLKVTPLPTPGGGVAYAPGAVAVKNTNPGGSQQMYLGRNGSTDTVDVQPTGSSGGRADMVAVVVRDPQYPGTPVPDDPLTARYIDVEVIQGVPANARTAADAGLTLPAYPLARINLPASTGTVLEEHITDLREVANPKTHTVPLGDHLVIAETQALSSTDRVFPRQSTSIVKFPEWATRVHVIATWDSVRAGDDAVGDADGRHWLRFTPPSGGASDTLFSRWVIPGSDRRNFRLTKSMPVYSRFRGQHVEVSMMGRKEGGPNVFMDGSSSWSVQLIFENPAV